MRARSARRARRRRSTSFPLCPGRSRGSRVRASLPARDVRADEVCQLAAAVHEAGRRARARAVAEIELELEHAVARAGSVDRHTELHAEPAREGKHVRQNARAQRALSGDRSARANAAAPANRKAREAEREPEPPAVVAAMRSAASRAVTITVMCESVGGLLSMPRAFARVHAPGARSARPARLLPARPSRKVGSGGYCPRPSSRSASKEDSHG